MHDISGGVGQERPQSVFLPNTNVVERYFAPAAHADPNAPGAFRFAEADSLARIVRAAGAMDVKERKLQFDIAAPISPKEFWEMRSETSGTLREKLATLPAAKRDQVTKQLRRR
jgi:hypothetical protein